MSQRRAARQDRHAGHLALALALFAASSHAAAQALPVAPLPVAPPPAAPAPAAPPSQAEPVPVGNANLNINPKRVTFDRLGKSAAIYVFNQGSGAGLFDVQLIDRLMLPSGQIIPLSDGVDKPELKPLVDRMKSAHDMVLATPRRISLAANSGQTIRVRAGGAGDVPPGEYRTHLTVTALPPADTGLTAEQAAAPKDRQLSFRVNTVLGLSIPVIIRVGPVDVRAGIENARLGAETMPDAKGVPTRTATLSFDLVRLGVNSLFGDVEVRGAKERGDKEPIGTVRGIGVYPEIERRSVKIALRRIPASGEQLDIVFRDDDVSPGKQLVRVAIPVP